MKNPIFKHNDFLIYRDVFGIWTASNLTTMSSMMSTSLDKLFAYMDGDMVFEPMPDKVKQYIDSVDNNDESEFRTLLSKHNLIVKIDPSNGCPMGLGRPLMIKAIKPEPILWARKCSVTGEGMNEGWVVLDGEEYFKNESDAIAWANDNGYDSLEDAYKSEAMYWTAWEDESDYEYQEVNGELIEIES